MLLLRRARVPLPCLPSALAAAAPVPPLGHEPWLECDLLVGDDRIVAVRHEGHVAGDWPHGDSPIAVEDLGGSLVYPGLLDVHTHLDKCHTWDRAPNPRGEFWEAIRILREDAAHWTPEDLHRRAGFGLRQAHTRGTIALRTHLDTGSDMGGEAHVVMQELKHAWAGKLELQTVSLCNLASFSGKDARRVVELTADHHAAALGGFPQPNPDLPKQLDNLMAAAAEIGLGLDLHVDESGLGHAECLRATAEAVLRNRFPHPVTCGHCCSLAVHEPARAASTIDLVRQAGIAVVTLPLCNQYLQNRGRMPTAPGAAPAPRLTPHWRGLTLVHEFMEAGVTVAAGSDNVRDAFYAWGAFDGLEVWTQAVRQAQLDTRLETAPALVTSAPAAIMGLSDYGHVGPGAVARLVLPAARTFNELLATPAVPRRLLTGIELTCPEPPALAEL